jgi:hypothetical protein
MSTTFGTATATGIMPLVIGGPPTNNYIPQAPAIMSNTPTFELVLSNTVSPSATVQILGSVAGLGWSPVCTLTASGPGAADCAPVNLPVGFTQYQANVIAISGSGAAVTVNVGW